MAVWLRRLLILVRSGLRVSGGDHLARHAEADGGASTLRLEGVTLGIGQVPATAAVSGRLLAFLLLPPHRIELLRGAVTAEGLGRCQQALRLGGVQARALA